LASAVSPSGRPRPGLESFSEARRGNVGPIVVVSLETSRSLVRARLDAAERDKREPLRSAWPPVATRGRRSQELECEENKNSCLPNDDQIEYYYSCSCPVVVVVVVVLARRCSYASRRPFPVARARPCVLRRLLLFLLLLLPIGWLAGRPAGAPAAWPDLQRRVRSWCGGARWTYFERGPGAAMFF
jgi:hypothetical protein